jgi:hypothetical protein
VSHGYVSIRKSLGLSAGCTRESSRSLAKVTLTTPTMQEVQDSWKEPGTRHASGVCQWVFVTMSLNKFGKMILNTRETPVSGFSTPSSRVFDLVFSTPESRVEPGLSCGTAGCGAYSCPSWNASTTARWKDQIAADISCYRARVQQHVGAS